MNPQTVVVIVLGVAVLLASVRFVWQARTGLQHGRGRLFVLLLQPVAAALLYLVLFPPAGERASDLLVVATAGSTPAQVAGQRDAAPVLALPEAPALAGVPRVPDLGTALRQHPEAARLLVLGAGLEARDREVVRGYALAFEATPLPRGLLELWSPSQVTIGAQWQVSGRVHALPGGSVELLDPAGRRADISMLEKDGRFVVHGSAPAPGRTSFSLRIRDARAQTVETVELPVQVVAGSALRVLVLAGGPGPELKYLRRWALDAGASLRSQISVGGGMKLGDAPVRIDTATLRDFDLVVLDERAWRELGAARRVALRDALHAGLGVLLRLTGPLSPRERSELQALGFTVDAANLVQAISLPGKMFTGVARSNTEPSAAADQGASPLLSRQALRVAAADAVALLRDDAGAALALWRSAGQGRIAVWWLGASHRLVLAGESAVHGRLWGEAFATLARRHGARMPWLASHDPRAQQRLLSCGLSAGASVEAADGTRTLLLLEASANASTCAAYWPGTPGWYLLRNGEASVPFFVRAGNDAPGLLAQAAREATEQLVTEVASTGKHARVSVPGPRWPWFLGWLLVTAMLWWLERQWLRSSR